MLKKISAIFLVTASFHIHADIIDQHGIWIRDLYSKTAALETKTSNLQDQINQIPKPLRYEAGPGIEIKGTVIQAKLNNQHHIGEEYRGGLVFYVDETGQHGLIASKRDVIEEGVQWRNGSSGNKVTNARSDGIGAGETNTRVIIAQQTVDNQKGNFAALKAVTFQVLEDGVTPCKTPIAKDSMCYGGWYLPSAFELQLMHTHLQEANLASFTPDFYWSSTEASATKAWLINFSTGELIASDKSNTLGRVSGHYSLLIN